MTVATAPNVALRDSYPMELRSLRLHPHNVLVEGPVDATDTMLDLLQPYIREPLLRRVRHGALDLPRRETRALIIRDVSTLTAGDQKQLLTWLGNEGAQTQGVSTTTSPPFALVVQGLFYSALYYRLNVLLLRVDTTTSTGSG